MRQREWGCKAPWRTHWSAKLFFPPPPSLCCCCRPSSSSLIGLSVNTHPVLYSTTQFHHLWRLVTVFLWSEGISVECGAPFLSSACAWLVWLSLAWERWTDAHVWVRATEFFSEMQACCVFELAQSNVCTEIVHLSLHKISKGRYLSPAGD